jgi:hypothetical protein
VFASDPASLAAAVVRLAEGSTALVTEVEVELGAALVTVVVDPPVELVVLPALDA